MDKKLQERLQESLYLHYPLQPEEDRSIEAHNLRKPVRHAVSLWDGKSMDRWTFDGEGEAQVTEGGILRLTTRARADHWPDSEVRAHSASAGLYATFGSYEAKLDVRGLDMSHGNRIWFQIRPVCPGLHSPIIRAAFVNNGRIKIPDAYSREGFNAINLKNNEWNTCAWEIDSIAHDNIEEVSFIIHRYGKEVSAGEDLLYELRDIQFQQVEANVVHGWQCASETAVFASTGYFADGHKVAIANTAFDSFDIVDADTEAIVFSGKVAHIHNLHGDFCVMDFSPLTQEGNYRIRFGNTVTDSFRIGSDILKSTLWKLTNFLFCERCGYPVPNKHGTCHTDVIAAHNGLTMPFIGGWHDAADVSQQTMQTAEILDAVMAAANSVRDTDRILYLRMLEEANWALDFVLRCRFGDGYRAAHAAIRRWTDGFAGNMDDCEADVNNRSFENFVFAAVEAAASRTFAERDPELAWKCTDAAKEDFSFALERFEKVGVEPPHMVEHTSGASLSQYYSAAAWAAARLYRVTGDRAYAEYAAAFADKVAACQETGGRAPMKGFFYRDETHKAIVHFSHQARDHIFVMALSEVCLALPEHPNKTAWEGAMRLFSDYLKNLKQYTAPYGMLPAGIYHISEADDEATFNVLHPTVTFAQERKNYLEQLSNAIDLGGGYSVRCFPVWFSYRGNSAIHLSMGKAASLLGVYFHDDELTEIAREQLYWTLGKNPFGQSLIYGEGSNYGQQYTALLGETVGEMPVGVQTRRNEDLPYWPQANIATYHEVWTTPPGRWLWIAADLMAQKQKEASDN